MNRPVRLLPRACPSWAVLLKRWLPLVFLLLVAPAVHGQALSVTNVAGSTPTDALNLANIIKGTGITSFANVTITAHVGAGTTKGSDSSSAGSYTGGQGVLGIGSGIILSSGGVQNTLGPNASDQMSQNNGAAGDADLAALISDTTADLHDATILEFDFIPTFPTIAFRYVFASEEYPEYANSQYNDVFGFFVNGHAPANNCALIPGTSTPVSINNVNGGNPIGTNPQHAQYYINNVGAVLNTEMDGLTTVFSAQASVTPGVVNHIKIAISDVGDGLYDSNVFIQQSSFVSGNAPVAVNDSYNVGASTPRVVAAAQGVLNNDSDLDNNLQSAQLITSPTHGTVVLNADGSFTYTPTNGYAGADSFTYQAVDTTFIQSNVGIVSLTVIAGPLAPSITTPTSASITSTTATLGGTATSNGGASITALGVVYSKTSLNASPQIGGANVTNLSGTVSNTFPYLFTVNSSGLTASTGYSYAAYATNSVGDTYTTFGTFTTSAPPSTTITSLNLVNSSPSNASTVNWTLTFAAANTGVTASNFSLSGAAATGASVGTPTSADGGIHWNVPVTTGSTDGTLTLSVANATGTTPGVSTTLPFAGQSYSMDLTNPTVTIDVPSTTIVGAGGSVTYAVTYADASFASSSLSTGGITLNTTGSAGGTIGVTGSGTSYTVTVSSVTGAGTIGISVAAGTSLDTAGNANLVSSPSTTFTVVPPPTVASISSTTTNGSYNATTLIPITVTFSAAVTVTGTPTLALNTTGTATYASGSGTSTLTFNYTVGAGQNTATDLDYASTSALALAGGTINATTGGTAANLTLPTPGGVNSLGLNKALIIDTTAPTITSINRLTPSGQTTASNSVTFRVTYSEAVTVPGGSNFSVIAVNGSSIVGTVTSVTGSGTTRDVTVSITSGTGEFRLRGVN